MKKRTRYELRPRLHLRGLIGTRGEEDRGFILVTWPEPYGRSWLKPEHILDLGEGRVCVCG